LVQFSGHDVTIVMRGEVRDCDQVREVVREAAESHSIIFYTLVARETRAAIEQGHREFGVPIVDLLGPTLSALSEVLITPADETPGLLYARGREEFDRAEAVNFAMGHDDGLRPNELPLADVVIVGVSRAKKSSTCAFLAMLGVKAANVPLSPTLPVPRELLELPPDRVVGLTIGVEQLRAIRQARADMMGMPMLDAYLDRRMIAQELRYANRMIEKHGWHSINAAYRAIEEIAKEVTRTVGIQSEHAGSWT
jgi:regulator of PEP synthase PpsR (kinase-PPPase family)